MDDTALESAIEDAFEQRDSIDASTKGPVRDAVNDALSALDSGRCRVAEKVDGAWKVNQWLKKAVLLSFRLNPMSRISGAPGGASWWDKVPSKFSGWSDADFAKAGFRAVPAPSFVIPPMSPPMSCSCRPSSISAHMSTAAPWSTPG